MVEQPVPHDPQPGPKGLCEHDLSGVPPEEIRFGVVMNGGVSLAVWMGGVSLELDRLVKAAGGKGPYADLLRQADHIYLEELRRAGLYDQVSQAFAVFLPVRSVGVMGDGRRYDWVIALRAVETIDFMTARWAHLPYDFLDHVSRRIINEVDGISRVTYDISGKPPATIEWE